MRDDRRDLASFARAVEALKPYLEELVFVGGWAHFLYTLRPEASPVARHNGVPSRIVDDSAWGRQARWPPWSGSSR
jgi:hypothetical protein